MIDQSLFIHYIWWAFARHWGYQISLKSLEIKKSYNEGSKFFDINDEFILDHAVKQWKKYHQLIHKISSSRDILDIHLIQPNPFVKNSKTLTSEEVYKINHSRHIKDYVVKGYPKLRAAIRTMKESEMVAEDLSYLFKNTRESIWRDAAHANRIGYEIVLDKVFELISKQRSLLAQPSN